MADIFGFDLNIYTKGESNEDKSKRIEDDIQNYEKFSNSNVNYEDSFDNLEEFNETIEKERNKMSKLKVKQEKRNRRKNVLSNRIC